MNRELHVGHFGDCALRHSPASTEVNNSTRQARYVLLSSKAAAILRKALTLPPLIPIAAITGGREAVIIRLPVAAKHQSIYLILWALMSSSYAVVVKGQRFRRDYCSYAEVSILRTVRTVLEIEGNSLGHSRFPADVNGRNVSLSRPRAVCRLRHNMDKLTANASNPTTLEWRLPLPHSRQVLSSCRVLRA
jgi:hypothetical protein